MMPTPPTHIEKCLFPKAKINKNRFKANKLIPFSRLEFNSTKSNWKIEIDFNQVTNSNLTIYLQSNKTSKKKIHYFIFQLNSADDFVFRLISLAFFTSGTEWITETHAIFWLNWIHFGVRKTEVKLASIMWSEMKWLETKRVEDNQNWIRKFLSLQQWKIFCAH